LSQINFYSDGGVTFSGAAGPFSPPISMVRSCPLSQPFPNRAPTTAGRLWLAGALVAATMLATQHRRLQRA
jgi:hypothetical protein